MSAYAEFLERKAQTTGGDGFEPLWLPEFLFPFQRALTFWAITMGRAAIFADCGSSLTSDRQTYLHLAAEDAVEAQRLALEKRSAGLLRFVADDLDCPDVLRLAALMEELGEVARCVHDGSGDLRTELVQLAGVALAWATVA